MNPMTDLLESQRVHLQEMLDAAHPGRAHLNLDAILKFAQDARAVGRADLAIPVLEGLVLRAPDVPSAWAVLGFSYAEEQRMPEAAPAFERAAQLAPEDAGIAMAYAQSSLDTGSPATHLFEHALQVKPGDPRTLLGLASAHAADGRLDAAEFVLADALMRQPDWLEGHKRLCALRSASGDTEAGARSYRTACRTSPLNLPLRLGWISALMQRQDWHGALGVIAEGEKLLGERAAFVAAQALIAGESGDLMRAEELFARTVAIKDDALQIGHVRHCLRSAKLETAETLAVDLMKRPSAQMVWPYLSVIWRLRGDERASWLDGAPPPIRSIDLNYSPAELQQLAVVLRGLHKTRAPYIDQSVRGGTQTDTDRQLFYRAEPEIQRLRAKVCAAVRAYVDALPNFVPTHPLLGSSRGHILFSGSWSVRLGGGGFHVSHTHPKGWISSALYVCVPGPDQLGSAHAGSIRFGLPPREFAGNLGAYLQIEPKPGSLVLFPSTLWHQTLPFDDGERLAIAFDVMRPRY